MNDSDVPIAATNAALGALTASELDPLFWPPARLGVESAWYGHVPFANWIIANHRPRRLVELGTHNGVSYTAFCEAVLRERLDTTCTAIDTWQGDEHAGFYGDTVHDELRRFHDARYGAFSDLRRMRFDQALANIPADSIDLLHIDGRHFYDDVREDFLTWRDRLSSRAVVLFHDTNVHEGDFGVWRLWAELRRDHAGFEFLHGHGLGVLAVGGLVDGAVAALCHTRDGSVISAVRERFSALGERWIGARDLAEQRGAAAALQTELSATKQWAERAQGEVNALFPQWAALTEKTRAVRLALAETRCDLAVTGGALSETRRALEAARGEVAALQTDVAARETDIAARNTAIGARESDIAAMTAAHASEIEGLRAALSEAHNMCLYAQAHARALEDAAEAMRASTSWRMTSPLRRMRGVREAGSVRLALAPPEIPTQPLTPAMSVPVLLAPTVTVVPAPGLDTARAPRALFISGEDHTPGHSYRILRYLDAARAVGFDASWKAAAPVGPPDLDGAKVVVLWRVPHGAHVQGIIDYARARGAAVVFDVDDLMFRPEMAVVDIIDGIRSQKFSEMQTQAFFTQIGRTLRASDLVTCPTEELAHHARLMGRPAYVLPNGFDEDSHDLARRARADWAEVGDDLLRIGYAGGSRTHQRDFAVAVPAIARVLAENLQARLTIFKDPSSDEGLILMDEFPQLAPLADRIEWRDLVPLAVLATELARFAINIAPLEADNPFCEAKSELKFFEAALAGVPTVASPSGPFTRAIEDGVSGCLPRSEEEWYSALTRLLGDASLRARMAQSAYHVSLGRFGPEARQSAWALMLAQLQGGAAGAAAFERAQFRAAQPRIMPPVVPHAQVVLSTRGARMADISVIVPVYNYADFVGEALQSVAAQTMEVLDLVVVDDASPDDSLDIVRSWLLAHGGRFNRVTVLRHVENAGLGFARNSGFAAAESRFVLPLDADNRLRPTACATLLEALHESGAAFAYPAIAQFGLKGEVFGGEAYSTLRLQCGNYIDAMALVRKSAWAAAGGYDHVQYGWEDYDFWCRLAERGHFGQAVPDVLADYRVHAASMLHTTTEIQDHKNDLIADLKRRHSWIDVPLKGEYGS